MQEILIYFIHNHIFKRIYKLNGSGHLRAVMLIHEDEDGIKSMNGFMFYGDNAKLLSDMTQIPIGSDSTIRLTSEEYFYIIKKYPELNGSIEMCHNE